MRKPQREQMLSALPPIATAKQTSRKVRFVPRGDIRTAASSPLFDDAVGGAENLRIDFEPERLRCLQVDDQFYFGRQHDWQIGGLFTLQNAADIDTSLTISIPDVRPIACKTAGDRACARFICRRKASLL